MAKRPSRRFGLKSKEWFYKQCLLEIDRSGPLARPSWEILMKGIAQEDKTRGHVTHPVGALQRFLHDHPHHRATISAAPANQPFDILADPGMAADWNAYFARQLARTATANGKYGRRDFHYSYQTLRTYLPPSLGGRVRVPAAGVGLDEFKRVLRLMADFLNRP